MTQHLHPNAKKHLAVLAGYEFKDKSPALFGNIPWQGFYKKTKDGVEYFVAMNDYNPNDIDSKFGGKHFKDLLNNLSHHIVKEISYPAIENYMLNHVEKIIAYLLQVTKFTGEIHENDRALKARSEREAAKVKEILEKITPKIESPSQN